MADLVFHNHHCHSHYSVGDAISKVEDIVKRSVELKMKSVTLTDHGTLGGLAELWQECKKANLKAILGVEGYYVDDFDNEESKIPYNYAHCILLAKTEEGWRNLKIIQSKAWEFGYLKKPRISFDLLKKHGKGLICTSACIRGLVGWNLLRQEDKAEWEFNDTEEENKSRRQIVKERINKFLELFGEDFYFEIHYNEIKAQAYLNKYVLKLAGKYNIRYVAANDCHYMYKKDIRNHDITISSFRKQLLDDPNNDQIYSKHTKELDVKDADGMRKCWNIFHKDYISEEQFNESIKSTMLITDKVEQFLLKPKQICLPHWSDNPRTDMMKMTEQGYLRKLTKEQQESKEYKDRLAYEYSVFDKLNMHAYMLVCADIIERAKKLRIPVGPGRGSVCGSLVAYCMDITEIDPIRFNIMFERFLISSRLSLPDIDMDFGQRGRDKIKDAVRQLYGEDKFAAIVTYPDWKPRGLIKDIGRVLGRSFQELNEITKKIHDKTKTFKDEEYPMNSEVMVWLENNKDIRKAAKKLEGVYRARGVHASGMILTPTKLEDWVPVAFMTERGSEDKKPVKVSEWDMYKLEDLEILKIDFLGLKTLDVIEHCVRLVNKGINKLNKKGIGVEPGKIENIWHTCLNDLENKEVYKMLCDGRLLGIFQMETSEGMHELIKNMKPKCFHDIVMAISLYRTAVIKAGMLEEYIKRRNGEDFEYIHKIVEPILKKTLGILVFQEDLMKIAVVAGGFTPQESDNFRKATKLKDPEKFKPWKDQFIKGCTKNGLTDEESATLWDWCYKFSGYGFNISHATAYGLITYATAWLKAFYPAEYMTALMTSDAGDDTIIPKYLQECKHLGIKIRKPDINVSTANFKLLSPTEIIHPLSSIKNVGEKALGVIISARANGKYRSFEDFCDRVNKTTINVRIMANLILAKCFRKLSKSYEETWDEFLSDRKETTYRQMYCETCKVRFPCTVKKIDVDEACCPACNGSNLNFDYDECRGKKFNEAYVSNQVYGYATGEDKLKPYVNEISKRRAEPLSAIEEIEDGDKIKVAVFVKFIKKWRDKNENEMAFIDISDGEYSCSLTVFAGDWEDLKSEIQVGAVYILTAHKNRGNNLLFSSRSKCKVIRLGL